MSEYQEPEVDPTRFIRIWDGSIYRYTSLMAKRKDAVIVDGYVAAQWFKAQGIENDITEAYPVTAPLDVQKAAHIPPVPKPNRNTAKEEQRRKRVEKLEVRAATLRRMREADRQPGPESEPELPLEEPGVVLGQELIGDVSDRR